MVGLLAGMRCLPLGQLDRPVRFDLVGAARQRPDHGRELGDLTVLVERVPLGCEGGQPLGVGPGGQVALGVDEVLEAEHHARVDR